MQVPMRANCVFHAAAKAGGVSKAAAELNVTPSAVTQQIQLLEMQLGTFLMVGEQLQSGQKPPFHSAAETTRLDEFVVERGRSMEQPEENAPTGLAGWIDFRKFQFG
jgi:LysR family transcriptional regulator, glycine cleavage system transcriptional activator